jgi:hypothetical protein
MLSTAGGGCVGQSAGGGGSECYISEVLSVVSCLANVLKKVLSVVCCLANVPNLITGN